MNTTRVFFVRCVLLLLAAVLCAACAPRRTATGPGGEEAMLAWQRFTARASAAEVNTGPFRVAASLRYTDQNNDSTRVSALLWGNGHADSPYPLRLDLIAGVGNVVAKIREDERVFLAYSPGDNTAFTHSRGRSTLVSFGVPIPLGLSDLTLILTGRCGELFLPEMDFKPTEYSVTDEGYAFTIQHAPLPGVLEISRNGAPLSWREPDKNGWRISFDPDDAHPLQPQKLRISHPKGYSALIVVRENTRLSTPFTDSQLGLILPPDVQHRPLHE